MGRRVVEHVCPEGADYPRVGTDFGGTARTGGATRTHHPIGGRTGVARHELPRRRKSAAIQEFLGRSSEWRSQPGKMVT